MIKYHVCFEFILLILRCICIYFFLLFLQLLASCKKFETLENAFGEVHDWVDNVNEILNKFTVDACGEYIDELRVSWR